MMSASFAGLRRARLLLGGALIAATSALAASCAEGIGATGYTDAFVELCDQVTRCYGDAYAECPARLDRMVVQEEQEPWLATLESNGCLDRCDALHRCLDYPPICAASRGECEIDDDCCGFSSGAGACEAGSCCRPIGADCSDSIECCASAGECTGQPGEQKTCGGVTCGREGEVCLNDFQCCTGRCGEDKRCEATPCPPEGFTCATDADCCDMICDPETKRCFDPPECSLLGQVCVVDGDCCDPGHVCFDGENPGSGGVCSSAECAPNNVDCFTSEQCCSGYCAPPPYRLCGECAKAGELCGPAAPCCGTLTCNAGGTCG